MLMEQKMEIIQRELAGGHINIENRMEMVTVLIVDLTNAFPNDVDERFNLAGTIVLGNEGEELTPLYAASMENWELAEAIVIAKNLIRIGEGDYSRGDDFQAGIGG